MAIQLPNPGLGDGQTGDNEFVMWTKVKDNFNNQTHAASREIGLNATNLADNRIARQAMNSQPLSRWSGSADDIPIGLTVYADTNTATNLHTQNGFAVIESRREDVLNFHTGLPIYSQRSTTFANSSWQGEWVRGRRSTGEWTGWIPITTNLSNYSQTTQANPNVAVASDGTLMRSTSSMKYKELIKHLELSADDYAKAMQVKPIVYRSKCDPDPSDWHYLSFSAEELGEYDPALTFWQTHETDPETGEQVELEQKEAEGINLNAICAVLHATNIYQDKKLKELEQRLTALESNNEPIE